MFYKCDGVLGDRYSCDGTVSLHIKNTKACLEDWLRKGKHPKHSMMPACAAMVFKHQCQRCYQPYASRDSLAKHTKRCEERPLEEVTKTPVPYILGSEPPSYYCPVDCCMLPGKVQCTDDIYIVLKHMRTAHSAESLKKCGVYAPKLPGWRSPDAPIPSALKTPTPQKKREAKEEQKVPHIKTEPRERQPVPEPAVSDFPAA